MSSICRMGPLRAHSTRPCCRPTPVGAVCPLLHSRSGLLVARSAGVSSAEQATTSTTATQQPQQPQQTPPPTSGTSIEMEAAVSPRKEAQLTLEEYKQIYDRLIKIFQERPRDDWKKLIVFSKQWSQHVNGVFDRIKELADKEDDINKKMGLRRMFRSLQSVNDEVARYNNVLKKFADAASDEWEPLVAVHRGDLQKGLFEHMQCLMAAAKGDKAQLEQLVMVNTRLVALVSNYDSVAADPAKLEAAADVYRDLLSSITSMEEADKKMAELSAAGKIDPAFLQISAKAYGAARDTNMGIDEAKWVAYKLYRHAKDYFDRQAPPEKRILEYLVSFSDPIERSNQLDKAITPGPTRFTDTHDYMWSTPERLYVVLDETLKAYIAMRDGAQVKLNTPEAAILPPKVKAMMAIRDEIRKRYL